MYAVWTEAGALFVGPASSALANTIIDQDISWEAIKERAIEAKTEDLFDMDYPSGLFVYPV